MINIGAICSIKNWPLTAEYGFYFLVSCALFFIPTSLVSAELATGWPERGGVYVWMREAFDHRTGLINLLGMKMSGWISMMGAILGTIIPGVSKTL